MQVNIKLTSLPPGQNGGMFQLLDGPNAIVTDYDMNKLISSTGFNFNLQPGTYSNITLVIGPNTLGIAPFTVNAPASNAPAFCNAPNWNNGNCNFTAWCGTATNQYDCDNLVGTCDEGDGSFDVNPCQWSTETPN